MGSPVDYRELIIQTANAYGVPPEIALSVAQQESGIRQWDSGGSVIRGGSGEIGMYQLMPTTAQELGVDAFDVNQNIQGGIRYLRKMYGVAGSWPGALIAYNGGPGTYKSGGAGGYAKSYADAVSYSQQVLARAGLTAGSSSPGQVVQMVPRPELGFDSWLAMQAPVYDSGAVFSTDVVGDASSRLGWILIAAGLVAALIITR